MGKPANILPVKILLNVVLFKKTNVIPIPPVPIMIKPRSRKFIPIVTTKELSLTFVTNRPFMNPIRSPASIAMKSPNTGILVHVEKTENAHNATPMVDGKERSVSPLEITKTSEQLSSNAIGKTVNIALYIAKLVKTLGFAKTKMSNNNAINANTENSIPCLLI